MKEKIGNAKMIVSCGEGLDWILVSDVYQKSMMDILKEGDIDDMEVVCEKLEKKEIGYIRIKSTKERPYIEKEFRGGR